MSNPLKSVYRRLRDSAFSIRPAKICREGFRFKGSVERFENSADEIGTARAIKALAPSISRFVNAGANSGYFCLLANTLGIPSIAFEPEQAMFLRLKRNISRNDCNCIPIPIALSNKNGVAIFYGTGTAGSLLKGLSGTPSWDKQTVTTATVDYLLSPPKFRELWLMDCEGAEPSIIQGSAKYIAASKPLIIFEYQPERAPRLWEECLQQLLSSGYDMFLQCSSLTGGRGEAKSLMLLCGGNQEFSDNILVFSTSEHSAEASRIASWS